jgi:hypothetical protein
MRSSASAIAFSKALLAVSKALFVVLRVCLLCLISESTSLSFCSSCSLSNFCRWHSWRLDEIRLEIRLDWIKWLEIE